MEHICSRVYHGQALTHRDLAARNVILKTNLQVKVACLSLYEPVETTEQAGTSTDKCVGDADYYSHNGRIIPIRSVPYRYLLTVDI